MTVRRPLWLQGLTGWSADDARRIIDADYGQPGVIRSGLQVTPNSPVAANVLVLPGYVVVPAKTATKGKYLGQVTANEVVTITANSSGNPRIDIIVAQVLDTVDGADGSDVLQVVAIAGTPAGSPVAPATPANATLLANVAVANGFATIVAGNITDKRIDVSLLGADSKSFMPLANPNATSTGSGTATWVTMGTITPPTWATRTRAFLTANGCSTGAAGNQADIAVKIGTSTGVAQRWVGLSSTSRLGFTLSDLLTAIPSGPQTVTIQATFQTGTLVAPNSACLFGLSLDWLP